MAKKARFLWVDDEVDLLKPYVLFLEEKGYAVECVNNGHDAIAKSRSVVYDLIFLDEHMPGLSGLETLTALHSINQTVPVVMITKSEDEGIMNQAIGKKITDYLIKPVNPHQILLTIKKILDKKEIITETASVNYREEFNRLSADIQNCASAEDWVALYKKLVYWEMELGATNTMKEILDTQKSEANLQFGRFIKQTYEDLLKDESVVTSSKLFPTYVFPPLDEGEKLFFILIDNFRLDQWEAIKNSVSEYFTCQQDTYFSILPTATQYARNAVFSGLMPKDIATSFPHFWVYEDDADGKNQFEEQLIQAQLERNQRKIRFSYHKINTNAEGEKLVQNFSELTHNDLNVLVFNFIDMLSHARTESKMLRELASDEAAYRSLTQSWFRHSPLFALLQKIAENRQKVILTSDHGTVLVKKPITIIGDKTTNSNLRYKTGKNLTYDTKKVFEISNPRKVGLPAANISTKYIFALNNDFFVYPNNQNHYISHYENTFQHGGISLEEMIVPVIILHPK